jgi:NAD(P)-dependent dehydrogenase (short-subunit alcohol dehydrogenase family)
MQEFRDQVALVTGGNRGIGFEIARGLARKGIATYLTSRSPIEAEKAAADIAAETGTRVHGVSLDVREDDAARSVMDKIAKAEGRLDVLVNNAGIAIDRDRLALDIDINDVRDTFETNLFGPWHLTQLAVPLMRRRNYGRIVMVSSSLGELPFDPHHDVWPAYGTSKLGLNALSIIAARQLAGTNVLLNVGTPGYCATAMSGADATRTAAQGADVMIWLATLPDGGPWGQCFYERERIAFAGAGAMNEDAPPTGRRHGHATTAP